MLSNYSSPVPANCDKAAAVLNSGSEQEYFIGERVIKSGLSRLKLIEGKLATSLILIKQKNIFSFSNLTKLVVLSAQAYQHILLFFIFVVCIINKIPS